MWPADNRTWAFTDDVEYTDPSCPGSFNSSIGLYSSADGRTKWSYHGIVLDKRTRGDGGLATPSVLLHRGGAAREPDSVLLFFTRETGPGGRQGAGRRGIGVARASHPLGPFVQLPDAAPAPNCSASEGCCPGSPGTAMCGGGIFDDSEVLQDSTGTFHLFHSRKKASATGAPKDCIGCMAGGWLKHHCIEWRTSRDGTNWTRKGALSQVPSAGETMGAWIDPRTDTFVLQADGSNETDVWTAPAQQLSAPSATGLQLRPAERTSFYIDYPTSAFGSLMRPSKLLSSSSGSRGQGSAFPRYFAVDWLPIRAENSSACKGPDKPAACKEMTFAVFPFKSPSLSPKAGLKTTDDLSNKRTVRLWAGSRFPVATRWKDPFTVNLARYLNATARLRDVVDVVSPSCFDIPGLHDTSSPGLHGLQMHPGCVERVRGLHAQGFRVEPLIGAGKNCTIDCIRMRLRDKAWISACTDAVSVLNASGLVFDIELETSTESDGLSFASLLTAVREELRSRVPDAAVSVATGTGRMGKTDVLANSTADRLISMGTYWQISSFQSTIQRDIKRVGRERYACGLCDSCAAQTGNGNNSVATIDERFSQLAAENVEHLAWWLLEYSSPNHPLNASFNHEHWWTKIREWKAAGAAASVVKTDDDMYGGDANGNWIEANANDDGAANSSLQWLTWYTFTGRSFVSSSSRALDDTHTSLYLERNLSYLRAGLPSVFSLTDNHTLWNETAMKANKAQRKAAPGRASEVSVLPSDWLEHINSFAWTVLKRGGVRGVMLGDELLCRGVPHSNLSAVTAELRKRLPREVWLWANECEGVHTLGPSEVWWSPALDVVSIDLYEYKTGKMLGAAEASHVKQYYEQHIFHHLGPHQKVAVVPGLFADSSELHHHNRTVQDAVLCAKLDGYMAWIAKEPRIVGVAPFHWDTFKDGAGSPPAIFRRGAEGFPKLLQKVAQLRRTIKSDDTTALQIADDGSVLEGTVHDERYDRAGAIMEVTRIRSRRLRSLCNHE
eukprot:COSAG01_NODE_172_length_23108_cov_26.690496_18_plen_1009_part_00